MKITIDSKLEKPIDYFEPGILYWHVPTGTVCSVFSDYSTLGVGFKPDGTIVDDWHFVEPKNYRKFSGVVKLSNK